MAFRDLVNNDYQKFNVIAALENAKFYLNKFKGGNERMDQITIFRGDYFFLSNFYNSTILFKGQVFQNAESAFQAQKCKDKIQKMRFANISGKEAKKLGRKVKLRPDWENSKEDIMYRVVFEKFRQNSYLRMKLLKTEDREIIEENHWHDNFYGNCTCDKCKNIEGENKLGKIIMKVRNELRELEK